MTRKQFDARINAFIWLARRHKKIELNFRYIELSIYEFYGIHRKFPRMFVKGGSFGLSLPEDAPQVTGILEKEAQ